MREPGEDISVGHMSTELAQRDKQLKYLSEQLAEKDKELQAQANKLTAQQAQLKNQSFEPAQLMWHDNPAAPLATEKLKDEIEDHKVYNRKLAQANKILKTQNETLDAEKEDLQNQLKTSNNNEDLLLLINRCRELKDEAETLRAENQLLTRAANNARFEADVQAEEERNIDQLFEGGIEQFDNNRIEMLMSRNRELKAANRGFKLELKARRSSMGAAFSGDLETDDEDDDELEMTGATGGSSTLHRQSQSSATRARPLGPAPPIPRTLPEGVVPVRAHLRHMHKRK
ncbi:uncharacterized protein LY89DRAFT_732062 [Mollisia scopiformis]|uniref:Uncharacterized protein n=1 Tax=Mollisia scopiformis TaxID=149040 RepID=A0A194XEA0_MOLSC|nr:uncharacterized protein LY89DRAFT_732062 [Mollisia scopiformis]KUJ18503.1 hypothetical protein LY89DRAFT_732062 [Mollisia scopiformis]